MIEALGLIAVSGDCSDHGMSDSAELIFFKYEHLEYVNNYLKASQDYSCYLMQEYKVGKKIKNQFDKDKTYKASLDTYWKLRDLGIFTNKYQNRTSWEIIELEPPIIKQRFPKFDVVDNFNIISKYESYKYIKQLKLSKKDIENWFGNRGIDINNEEFEYLGIQDQNLSKWLFIYVKNYKNPYYEFDSKKVELYALDIDIVECYDSFNVKNFQWTKSYIKKLLPKDKYFKWYREFSLSQNIKIETKADYLSTLTK